MQSLLDTIAHLGGRLLVAAVTVLVFDLAAMITYTIRNGSRDEDANESAGPRNSILLDNPRKRIGTEWMVARKYRSKTKILGQASGFITDDSLIDGTATLGQRMMVHGIKLWFACMWLILVSAGMSIVSRNILGIWLIVAPTVWFAMVVRLWHNDYQAAKKRVQKRRTSGEPSSPESPESSIHMSL